ncbi:cytochrome o ubiquinol oxidase subunit IV [Tropicimonas sp. IMCC34043]|uniref:cytochrome o ubiquinol oxidase subunit IV n=1 Tax=Tropicimonas sp. IMCC34043 TaxID=2248760 RepID=UPI000E22BD70|nr:cytochrome o ubiquinol oxidase subunit IV [Tropicimonas sp. IMCC34043]
MSDPAPQSNDDGYRRGLRGYLSGFLIAALLTAVPFWAVATGRLSAVATIAVIAGCGIVQFGVHLRYFLHVDLSPGKRDELHLILFSLLLLIIMVAGTIWIMVNLNLRMLVMPGGDM